MSSPTAGKHIKSKGVSAAATSWDLLKPIPPSRICIRLSTWQIRYEFNGELFFFGVNSIFVCEFMHRINKTWTAAMWSFTWDVSILNQSKLWQVEWLSCTSANPASTMVLVTEGFKQDNICLLYMGDNQMIIHSGCWIRFVQANEIPLLVNLQL